MRFGEFIDLALLAVGAGHILDDAPVQRQEVAAYAPTAIGWAFEEWYDAQLKFAMRNGSAPLLDAIGYTTTEIGMNKIKYDTLLRNFYFLLPGNVFTANGAVFVKPIKDKAGNKWLNISAGSDIIKSFVVAHDETNNTSKIIFSEKPTCGLFVSAFYRPDCDKEDMLLGVPDTVTAKALQLCESKFLGQAGKAVELAPDFHAIDHVTKRPL